MSGLKISLKQREIEAVGFKSLMRPRKPNWSTEQKLLLVQLVKARRENLLTGRHSCREAASNRRWAWDEIAEEISTAHPDVPRTGKECERHWFVELAKAKEAMTSHRPQADLSPVTLLVLEILRLQKKDDALKDSVYEESVTYQEDSHDEQVEVKYVPTTSIPVMNTEMPVNHTNNNNVQQNVTGTPSPPPPPPQPPPLPPPPPPPPPPPQALSTEQQNLELAILHRQERVLRLQEEYYTLKIKHLKAQMLMDL